MSEFIPDPVSVEVGARIRKVRHARGLTLEDVQRGSTFTASAMGAYERGFRTLSLPRLYEVAAFLGVPVSVLLGLDEAAAPSDKTPRLIFDLQALGTNRVTDLITDLIGDAHEPDERVGIGPLRSFVRSIAAQRGDWNGRILTLRGSDIAAVMVFVGAPDAAAAFAQLKAWGVLIEQP